MQGILTEGDSQIIFIDTPGKNVAAGRLAALVNRVADEAPTRPTCSSRVRVRCLTVFFFFDIRPHFEYIKTGRCFNISPA
ncbi:MAG: hypothetical protein V1913_14040 [Fibrobacterota bacterium]